MKSARANCKSSPQPVEDFLYRLGLGSDIVCDPEPAGAELVGLRPSRSSWRGAQSDDAPDVVGESGAPGLGWGRASLREQPRGGAFGDINMPSFRSSHGFWEHSRGNRRWHEPERKYGAASVPRAS